jgi:DNA-binding SARP family transcriptional activator
MEGEDDEWLVGPRQHHDQLHQAALLEAALLWHERGDRAAAVTCLEELVRACPLDEPASARLMQILGELGRRDAVQQEYERLAQALDEAWEAVPSRETRRLYLAALRG